MKFLIFLIFFGLMITELAIANPFLELSERESVKQKDVNVSDKTHVPTASPIPIVSPPPPVPIPTDARLENSIKSNKTKEKVADKWNIKGRIGDSIILVKNTGSEIFVLKEGEQIDDCVVQYPRLFCDLADEIHLLALNLTNKSAMFRIDSENIIAREGDIVKGRKIISIGVNSTLIDNNGMKITVRLENSQGKN